MRLLTLAALLAAAGAAPAFAQIATPPLIPPPDYGLMVQQEQLRQQMIQQQNQLQVLDAQIRSEQALQEVQRLRVAPQLPLPDTRPGHALPNIDTRQLASIPDAALADSNKKVIDAANNRR